MTLTIADTRGLRADDGVVSSSAAGPRSERPRRRVFTPEYKLAMVAEYDRASTPGQRGGLLRREGLYHSHIIEWRKARDAGTLVSRPAAGPPAGAQDGQGRSSTPRRRRGRASAEQAELERLRRQNEKLAKDLARTRAALDIMGKAHALLELLSESVEPTSEQGSST
jgi:transposase-like protein